MAGKQIWVTWLTAAQSSRDPKTVVSELQQKGLRTTGALWSKSGDKLAFAELANLLGEAAGPDLWLIAAEQSELSDAANRFALSLVTAMVRDNRDYDFPVFVLGLDFAPTVEQLPLLMRDARVLNAADKNWAASLIAASYRKRKNEPPPYRFSVRAHPAFGLWFEVGPRKGEWKGVMAGLAQADAVKITHHAVGQRGVLPERTVLEYPLQGVVAQVGGQDYTAWATQNTLRDQDSYYIRVEGQPEKLLFGGYPDSESADVHIIDFA